MSDDQWVPTPNVAQSYDLDHWLCCVPQPLKFHFTTHRTEPRITLSLLEKKKKKIGNTNDETILTLLTQLGPFNSLQIALHVFAHFYIVTIQLLIPLCVLLFST